MRKTPIDKPNLPVEEIPESVMACWAVIAKYCTKQEVDETKALFKASWDSMNPRHKVVALGQKLGVWQKSKPKPERAVSRKEIAQFKRELEEEMRKVRDADGSLYFSEEEIASALKDPNIALYIRSNVTPEHIAEVLSM